MKIFAFDNETNGLPGKNRYFSTISIGYYILDDDMSILTNRYRLLNRKDIPANAWDKGAMRIHMIPQLKSIRQGEKPEDALKQIKGLMLSCDALAAHNIPFDLEAINTTFKMFGIDPIDMPTICTMELSKRNWPTESKSLKNTWERIYGKSFNQRFTHHNALDDARACVDLLKYFHNIKVINR